MLFAFSYFDFDISVVLTFGAICLSSANRMPEKLAPGRFDLYFASHQIFHVLVLLAALAHYEAILTAFDYRHRIGRERACMEDGSVRLA